ncbi:MAG: sugar phosphate nucleotidyltransferase [Solirubrobacteraceae bacterium]
MQALILAGGEGTRLRPLTSTVPKPVVPLVDRPFAAYMLEWLRSHGVDDVVMACGFMAEGVRDVLGDGSALGVRLRYLAEPRPLGTAGAIRFAQDLLDERFLVLNGDVLTDIDVSAQIAAHETTGARATLALMGVEDPTGYGLVSVDGEGRVTDFLEKPGPGFAGAPLINAGVYVLARDVIDLIEPEQMVSIERDVFPALIGDGLQAVRADGYWMDIGTPERYLQGTYDILEGRVATPVRERLGEDGRSVGEGSRIAGSILPPALLEDDCQVAEGATVGGGVVLRRGVSVGAGSRVERAVVLEGAEIGSECSLSACVVGPGARVGDGCTIEGGVMLGEGVSLGAGNQLKSGARLFPGVSLPDRAIAF